MNNDGMKATIEQDGRLLVLQPHLISIQSPEGKRYIRERHAAVMRNMEAYPTLRKHLFTDKWADKFMRQWLAESRTLASLSSPAFYLELSDLDDHIYPRDYLSRADAGLQFLVAKAPSANRKDLIGNLLGSVSVSAEFEVMLAWALSDHFGVDKVVPYPRIGPNERKTVDFAITQEGERILIEATVLLDDHESSCTKQHCIEYGTPGVVEFRTDDVDVLRLLSACLAKAHQRSVKEPLFLCVNQYATWPDPATGAESLRRWLADMAGGDDGSMFVGIAYFYSGRFVASGRVELLARKMQCASLLDQVDEALSCLNVPEPPSTLDRVS